jgi:SAM-dependent methyltransferase
MASRDIFRYITEQDKSTLDRIIERMEFRGKNPVFRGWLMEYLGKLKVTAMGEVLALGCGTGVEIRSLLSQSGFFGRVVGIDLSPELIDAAYHFSIDEGIDGRVEYYVGDVHNLEFTDSRFEAVIAHTLISHVAEPLTVLREAARVVKPGGQIVIFDGDYASWSFGHSDPEFGKTMEEAMIASMVNNPRIMRTLPHLLRDAGLQLESVTPHHLAEIGKGNFFISAIETYGPLPGEAGLIPKEKVNAWLKEQIRNDEKGIFFGSGNYYTYIAKRI